MFCDIMLFFIHPAHIQRLIMGIDNLVNPTPCKLLNISHQYTCVRGKCVSADANNKS